MATLRGGDVGMVGVRLCARAPKLHVVARPRYEPCTRHQDVHVISSGIPPSIGACAFPRDGCAASAIGGSEDGRASLYGDGLVRLRLDGSAAHGAPAKSRA